MVEMFFLAVHKDGRSTVTLLQQGFLLIVQVYTPADAAYGTPHNTASEFFVSNDYDYAYARFLELSKAETIRAY